MSGQVWVEVNGVALRYRYRAGEGPVYVLVHEMGGAIESWDRVVKQLPGNAAVLAYDQRGFGLSEKPVSDMEMSQHVADLAALLDHLGIDRKIVIAGVAVGGGVAIAFAARHPDRVAHLLAMAPACGVAADRREGALHMADAIAANGMRVQASALFEMAYPEILRHDREACEQYRLAWFSTSPRSLAQIYRMLALQNLDADIASLKCPTVLIGGQYDALRPETELRRIAALCPEATCLIAPTGHFMQINSPNFVAWLLRTLGSGDDVSAGFAAYLSAPESRAGVDGPLR